MMTARRPCTLLSFSFSVSQTHTCTDAHSPCLPISRSLCLVCVSLSRLPLPPSHAHTDNGILYIVSLTQRRKHAHTHEHSGKRTFAHTLTCTHIYSCVQSYCSAWQIFQEYTHRRYTFFFPCIVCLPLRHTLSFSHTHIQTLHYSLCLGILHFDEGGSTPSNKNSRSRERPSQRRQQGGSEAARWSAIRSMATSSALRRPLVCGWLVVWSARLDKNPSSLSPPLLSVLGCSYWSYTTAERVRVRREEGHQVSQLCNPSWGCITTTTSSRGAARWVWGHAHAFSHTYILTHILCMRPISDSTLSP